MDKVSIEQLGAIEDGLLTALRAIERDEDIDDLDDDDDFDLVIELSPGGTIVECLQARCHGDNDYDPYWELGDGD